MEPWLSLGYTAAGLGRYLRRMARANQALIAYENGTVLGIATVQPDVLLGHFIALLAVRPEAAGKGIGTSLVARIERDTFRKRQWLYVSSDSTNRSAARFYRKLGFSKVARLTDLIRNGHAEILWRKRRPNGSG
jgi:ribosomal protein S18 acetylase RimI-like enzyme